MIIKILGTKCRKCDKLEDNTKLAIEELKVDASIEKVTDFKDIMKYGVMQTPALVVDEKVEAVGKSLSTKEIKQILSKR